MQFNEAVSKRIYELCDINNYTPNRLAEISTVPPSTLHDIIKCKRKKPNAYHIFQLCKALNITLKDFYDSDLFLTENIED